MVLRLRSATENEVVHAFLREVDSERWAPAVTAALKAAGGSRDVVDHPNFADDEQNSIRRQALAKARGWGHDVGMFKDFPTDVEWSHGQLEPADVERLRYVDYSYWNALSGGTRRVIDVEATIRQGRMPEWLVDIGTGWCDELAAASKTDS